MRLFLKWCSRRWSNPHPADDPRQSVDASRKQAFISEVANLIRSAEYWHTELEKTIASGPGGNPNEYEWQVQERLKALLVSVCGIARILDPHPRRDDPAYGARKERGKELRNELNIELDSPIFSTEVRDSLEHLDERIDDWLDRHPGVGLQTWRIYNFGEPVQLPGNALREFDVSGRTLKIGTDSATIPSIIAAVRGLKKKVPKSHRLDIKLTFVPGQFPRMDLDTHQVPGTDETNP
jgi:hypothetical protein